LSNGGISTAIYQIFAIENHLAKEEIIPRGQDSWSGFPSAESLVFLVNLPSFWWKPPFLMP
jgi:hypothetical protein